MSSDFTRILNVLNYMLESINTDSESNNIVDKDKVISILNHMLEHINTDESNKPLVFKNNVIENHNYNANIMNNDSSVNYKYIYDVKKEVFTSNGATYTEYENQSISLPFSDFNRCSLYFIKTGNAEYMYNATITGYNPNNKLLVSNDVNRKHVFSFTTNDGYSHMVKFTINTDGTFDFSSDEDIALLRVRLYNE